MAMQRRAGTNWAGTSWIAGVRLAFAASATVAASAPMPVSAPVPPQNGYTPAHHSQPPPIYTNLPPEQVVALADQGMVAERDRAPVWQLAEHRRIDRALAGLLPQRKGVVDAYVVTVALDSDPVFGREVREAGKVLARRYDAVGRTVVLAGTDGSAATTLPRGAPENLALVLARMAELMDVKEDVLILYTTSHGAPIGIVYNDGDAGFGVISPRRLAGLLSSLGLERRIVMISACYSGIYVPLLATDDAVLMTASAADRTSFGCQADSDWTFFGDALVNHALRQPQSFLQAVDEATMLIGTWEGRGRLTPSQPQAAIGARAATWLATLEARIPKVATAPVGKPAVSLFDRE